MKIQAANGLVFEVADSVATGLVASKGNGFSEYREPVTPVPVPEESKPAPRKRGRPPKSKG